MKAKAVGSCLLVLVGATLVLQSGCDYDPINATPEELSSHHMQQLLDGLRNHSTLHRDERIPKTVNLPVIYPPSLDSIVEDIGGQEKYAELLVNPLTGDNPGYEYERPEQLKYEEVPGDTIVLYQLRGGERDLTLPVGFADGVVALIPEPPKQLELPEAKAPEPKKLDFDFKPTKKGPATKTPATKTTPKATPKTTTPAKTTTPTKPKSGTKTGTPAKKPAAQKPAAPKKDAGTRGTHQKTPAA